MIILSILRLAEALLAYEPRDKFLHRLNPITKLVFLIVVIVAGVYLSEPTVPWLCNLGIFAALTLAGIFGGVSLGSELRRRWPVVAVLVGILLFGNLIFSRGFEAPNMVIYLRIRPFIDVTNLSLNYALAKSLFLLCSLAVVVLLLKSTRMADLTHSLQRVGVPYAIGQVVATSLRCIPMVVDGLLIVYNAQRARGFELESGSVKKRIGQWRTLLHPLFVVLLKWVDLMSLVFQARGLDFDFGKPRSRLREVPFRIVDAVVLIVGVGALVSAVYAVSGGLIHV